MDWFIQNGPNIEPCASIEAMYDWPNSSTVSMKLLNDAVSSYECQSLFYFFYVAIRLMNYWIENTALDCKNSSAQSLKMICDFLFCLLFPINF